jgi:AraC-like DNA-binding protein
MCDDPKFEWQTLRPRIAWSRCNRRRWDAFAELPFSREQRRKTRHVLLYFWEGRGRRRTPGGETVVSSGVCYWSRPGWAYSCHQDKQHPLGITAIHFDLINASGDILPPEQIQLPPEVLPVQDAALAEAVTRHIADMALQIRAGTPPDESRIQAAEIMLQGLLQELTAGLLSEQVAADEGRTMWRQVDGYIQAHLTSPPSVEWLAQHWGYTRSHFSREFTAHYGLPPQTYILNARLAHAKELLRETELSMGQIAQMTGFASPAIFATRFRQKTGMSPTAYRQLQES